MPLALELVPAVDDDQRLVDEWLATFTRSGHSLRQCKSVARWFRAWLGRRITSATTQDVVGWLTALENRGVSAASRNTYQGKLGSLLSFAVKTGRMQHNPAEMVQRAIATPKELRFIEPEVARERIAGIRHEETRVLADFLYVTGLRISEAWSITWASYKCEDKQWYVTVTGKGGRTRTVWVPDRHAYRTFKYSQDRARRLLHKASALYDDDWWPHLLRHWCCSHRLAAGEPITDTQKQMGHGDIRTTASYVIAQPKRMDLMEEK